MNDKLSPQKSSDLVSQKKTGEVVKRPQTLPEEPKSKPQVDLPEISEPTKDAKTEFEKAQAQIKNDEIEEPKKKGELTNKGDESIVNIHLTSKGDSAAVRIFISILLMGFGLGGFFVLQNWFQGVLWFLFLLVVYPLSLAFTTNVHQLERTDIVKLYEVGVSQIPLIGEFLTKFFFASKDTKPPD